MEPTFSYNQAHMTRAFSSILCPTLAALLFATGCLSTGHRIPKQELIRLSQTPPAQRGEQVRVIQSFAGDDGPPEQQRIGASTLLVVTPGPRFRGPTGAFRPNLSKLAKAKKQSAKAWLIIAAFAALGLAVTEGARYDGWVQLNPMHPVHLFGPYGEYTWMPLAQLQPDAAAWASRAMVRPSEGPWNKLGRAPLNRRGFNFSLLLGSAELPSHAEEVSGTISDTDTAGFQGHIQFGYFPSQVVGLAFDIAMGYRDNAFGDVVYENRNALELQAFPLFVGRFHAGAYADIGWAVRLEDGANGRDKRSFYGGAGVLAQLEITTRLALTGRLGLSRVFGQTTNEASLGVSIY